MKTSESIKLLRALNGLSQVELAAMMGSSRELCASIENDKKVLVRERAESLARALHVDPDWLLGKPYKMLEETGFALFCYDGSKAVGTTFATQERAHNFAQTTVKELLPQVLAYENASYCFQGVTSSGEGALFFFVCGGHALMIKIINSKDMVDAVSNAISKTAVPVDKKMFDASDILAVDYSSPQVIAKFIYELSVTDDLKKGISELAAEQSKYLSRAGNKAPRGKKLPVSATQAQNDYAEKVYKKQVSRIATEIAAHGLKLNDIEVELLENGRSDLLKGTSHRPVTKP